ncbi:hypothetical protein NQ317_013636 [Molorchus minor]|uniref:EF-hand domain-containing protein n=1 Tax=Molorchus minor TaxID=1323400 RepID=A0ABQ9JWM5_9CUCU|nr:hypothetical protein NQ317_013636 [Molorchus minor]
MGEKQEAKEELDLDFAAFEKLDISKDQLKSKYLLNFIQCIVLPVLKQIFDSFDLDKKGEINIDMIGQILDMLGHQQSADELQAIISEIDEDGNGVMSFEEFANLAARFLLEEEEDTEAILRELKDAFRLYDKEGKAIMHVSPRLGYIGVDLLKDILKELEPNLSPSDLNEMIKEIDTDNSGTVDWEEARDDERKEKKKNKMAEKDVDPGNAFKTFIFTFDSIEILQQPKAYGKIGLIARGSPRFTNVQAWHSANSPPMHPS